MLAYWRVERCFALLIRLGNRKSSLRSPWQRGSNENLNGLIAVFAEVAVLSRHTQEELDAIVLQLNMRPRKLFGFRWPIEGLGDAWAKHHESPPAIY